MLSLCVYRMSSVPPPPPKQRETNLNVLKDDITNNFHILLRAGLSLLGCISTTLLVTLSSLFFTSFLRRYNPIRYHLENVAYST
jgi:hypothetical protein